MRFRFSLLAILTLAFVLNGCAKKVVRTYKANVPVYQSKAEWRSSAVFKMEGPRDLQRPGKIYIYGQFLLVNERLTGVHFFDNSNPSNPVNIGFLPVLANVDMAVRNSILYLDTYSDLLAFDISDIRNPRLQSRTEDVLAFDTYGGLDQYDFSYPTAEISNEKGIVVGWTLEKITEDVSSGDPWRGNSSGLDPAVGFTGGQESLGNPNIIGTGGSTARFTIWGHHLYTLGTWQLDAFDIKGEPLLTTTLQLPNASETLFPYQGRLFIGTTRGMLVYSLNNPESPVFISEFEHVRSCDPVVVQGDRAYVTLRTGGPGCQNGVNRVEIIDISNIERPDRIAWHTMNNPRGLGVDGDLLFICDGPSGLKVYDKTDPHDIPQNLVGHFSGIVTNDVIPFNGILLMTSEDGIFQYDYSDPTNIFQLSHLPIVR